MADNYYLCEDLIVDIFKRLPPKSLIRFRSLSKSWCSRIASPNFIRKYTRRSKETSSFKVLIKHDCYGEEGYRELNGYIDISTVEFPYIYTDIVNSCNGIFCLCDRDIINNIRLWNPSIRRNLTLPDHPSFQGNPRNFSTAVGLGFDPITDDYKIVRISYHKNKEAQESSFVYSMKARSWCGIASPAYPFQSIWSDTCFFNVALHWVARYLSDYFIITFNLSTHVFGKITLPEPNWETEKPTIINGCLAVISYESDFNCWIWVMKEYNNASSWYVLFKVPTDPDIEGGMKRVLQLTPNGYFLINTYFGGIEMYDLATGVPSVLVQGSFKELEMATFLESIELLDRGTRD